MNLFDPSTVHGALIVGIIAGLISGALIGFFSGKTYQKKVYNKAINKIKGDGNVNIQNSKIQK